MKLITIPMFQHSLIAPKGFKFDLTKVNIIKTVLGSNNAFEFRENNTLIRWTEFRNETYSDLGSEFFNQYLGNYIIEIDSRNHYKWLDDNLDEFWHNVFGKSLNDTNCENIISEHVNKCYQYKDRWLTANIPFFYGVAIYLLTYSNELGDTPDSERCQWVIDNYEKYVKMMPDITNAECIQYNTIESGIELKDEMYVTLNLKAVQDDIVPDIESKLLIIDGKTIQLTKNRQNSSRVVDGKIMIKGVGIFDKKYFTEVKV